MAWLRSMALFCEELQSFVCNEVPRHADASSYTHIPHEAIQKRHLYANLLAACGWDASQSPARYMTDIPCHVPGCKDAVELVQGLGAETYAVISVFRCAEGNVPPTKELFFEAPLNMCMALGTEHGWLDLAECRARARRHLQVRTGNIGTKKVLG
jgi:hypothetical protein